MQACVICNISTGSL